MCIITCMSSSAILTTEVGVLIIKQAEWSSLRLYLLFARHMWCSWLFEIEEQSRWGGRCGWGHLIPSMLQGQREEKKEHNWIRYQNKVSVCFNYSSDTGSSWKHREPAERENERKRKRWSKGVMEGEKEKRERKAERAAGVNGPQAVAGAWEQRLEGGAVWEVPGLSEFSVRSPNWVDSGHFHYHNTAQICPKAALLTNPATKGILEERSSREIDSLFVEDYLDFRKIPSCCYCANKHFCKLLEDKKNSWNLRLGMSTLLL